MCEKNQFQLIVSSVNKKIKKLATRKYSSQKFKFEFVRCGMFNKKVIQDLMKINLL